MLLSTAYFPPVTWFALALKDLTLSPDRVLPFRICLEACENYQKQSYRNRCYILASDGPQMLQVPVLHRMAAPAEEVSLPEAFARIGSRSDASGRETSAATRSIRSIGVDYSTPWVLRTQRALDTAYETSAFYEYYRDQVFALLDRQPQTLWELNLSTIRWALQALGVPCSPEATTSFAVPGTVADDFRYAVHPKLPPVLPEKPYYQVFRDRLECFTPGLSVIDLIFNEGPGALTFIR